MCKDSFFYRKVADFRIKSYICKDEKYLNATKTTLNSNYLNDYIMETCHWVLVGWVFFDLLVFIWAWWDNLYYSHDMKNKFKRLKETLTEE